MPPEGFQNYLAQLRAGVADWASDSKTKEKIAKGLKDPAAIDDFLTRMGNGDFDIAMGMVNPDSSLGRGFGVGVPGAIKYGHFETFLSDKSLSEMTERAIKAGAVVTIGLGETGAAQVSVYYDHNTLVFDGRENIDYDVLGMRLVAIIRNTNVQIKDAANLRLMAGAAAVRISGSANILDALFLETGGQLEIPLGNFMSCLVTGEVNRIQYFRKDVSPSFISGVLATEIGKTFPGKTLDIQMYVGATQVFNPSEAPFNPAVYVKLGLTNIMLWNGALSFDMQLGVKKQSKGEFFTRPDLSATISYQY